MPRPFPRALRDLALALLNATLILVALCLFLALRLADRVDAIAETAAQGLVSVAPLHEDMQGMTREVAALRGELATLSQTGGEAASEAARALSDRLERVDEQVAALRSRIGTAEIAPDTPTERAILRVITEIAALLGNAAGCERPQAARRE
ncbi:MAG: hypothetical protein ACK5JR_10025 [Tropicimonas sp.]|uniref:hypothetical protein n=1 Tax=Tropicimonas sp. TaxID=2067044 RepID=UPI003A8C6DC5